MKKFILFIAIIGTLASIGYIFRGQIINSPIGKSIQENILPGPTEIKPDPVAIVKEIKSLCRLETADISIESVINAERDDTRMWGIFGEKLTLIAYGDVVAGVDLSKIKDTDIQVIDADTVIICLPAAEIFSVTLDNKRSYIVGHQIGIFSQVATNLESQARAAAQDQLEIDALSAGILNLANSNAQNQIGLFLQKFNIKNIDFAIPA
jgi:hypothetical protein